MSASSKKKLRREQVMAEQTQKQQAAKKESARMKLYTIIFFVVIALMIAVVVITAVTNSGIIERNTTALKVGDKSISAVELNMYYMEAINAFYHQYGSAITLFGLDPTLPLDEQSSGEETGTWADYFIETAKNDIQSNYAIYNAAVAAGYELSDEDSANIDAAIENLKATATDNGFSNVKEYLVAFYGPGANLDAYRNIMEVMAVATSYQTEYQNSLTYSDDAIQAKDDEDPIAYNSYSYNTYVIYASSYLEGGTTDEEGNVTYTAAETASSVASAKTDAIALANGGYTTVEELDAAIAALPVNAEKTTAASTASNNIAAASIPSYMQEWITDSSRQPGDLTYVERTTENSDGETVVSGYNVILFRGSSDNRFPLANVRHILISYEGGTTDSTTGTVTYSDAEKAAAKELAQALLDEWAAGDADEASFAALAEEHSTDPGSNENGGLYEDIYYGEMLTNFNDWCFDEAREPGDTGLVETEHGYHVMYYSSDSERTNREHLIAQDLLSADMDVWYQAVLDASPIADVNLSRVNRGLVIAPSYG